MANGFDSSIPDLNIGGGGASFQMPSFDMPSFDFSTPQFDFGGFSPSLDLGGFNAPSFNTPSFGAPGIGMTQAMPPTVMPPVVSQAPAFNEMGIPHNYLSRQAALPPAQAPQGQQGMLTQLFGRNPTGMEIGMLGLGLLPLLMGTVGAFGNERPRVEQAMQPQTTTRTAAPAGLPENTALLNALLGTFSPILDPTLVEQAFEPQLGSLAQQSIQAAQERGFHTSPLESPVAQRMMSQGLSDLQGQIAAAKLAQQQFASNLGANLFGQLQGGRLGLAGTTQTGGGSTTSQLGGPSPLFGSAQQLASILGALGQGVSAFRPQQQPNTNIYLGGGTQQPTLAGVNR